MSPKNPLIKIGKIIDAHSLSGEVKVYLFSGEASWVKRLKECFLSAPSVVTDHSISDASLMARFEKHKVEKARVNGDRLILKLKEVKDRTHAEKLKGSEIFISETLLVSKKGEPIFLREILGFTVLNGESKVGEITGFEASPLQDIIVVKVVEKDGSEFSALVPLVKDFLVSIDYKQKKVFMNLPDGLIEANKTGTREDLH